AYGARPVQCSTYPFWPWILKSRESWDAEAKDCKGMNCGALRSAQEIDEQKFLYEHNTPITRKLSVN
ncbi:MAG: YkgJ family cysteine cluster protein, partial [Treponemataceae bacterium]|nr:YkgJ family cysteine cluster protein [Treponemataceae bacterium]